MNTLYEKDVKVNDKNAKYAGQEGYLKVGVRYINLDKIKIMQDKKTKSKRIMVEQVTQPANSVFAVIVTFKDGSKEIFNFANASAANGLVKRIKTAVIDYKLSDDKDLVL